MAEARKDGGFKIEVSAVVARIRIPAGILAGFGADDRMEIESRSGLAPAVAFIVNGRHVASATLVRTGDLLTARITRMGPETERRVYDRWLISK